MIRAFNQHKRTLIITIIVIGVFVAYQQLYVKARDGRVLSSQVAGASGSAAGQEIINVLSGIRGINLDTSIFEDDTFNSLVDFTQEVRSEPVGRSNPFAPVGFGIDISGTVAKPTPSPDNIVNVTEE